jgi:hypothetical protein
MAMELQEMHVLIRSRAFYLAASYRQIKESLLCVLGGEISILDKNDFVPEKALSSDASKMVDFFFALWETVEKLGGRSHIQETHSRDIGGLLSNDIRNNSHWMHQTTYPGVGPGRKGYSCYFLGLNRDGTCQSSRQISQRQDTQGVYPEFFPQ